ncbi:MAG: penicillin-binding protein 2 [Pseudobacteriovorax sp.]|nr:penicillin-binding protein 2 [Pseudobacteriovorax sp.]
MRSDEVPKHYPKQSVKHQNQLVFSNKRFRLFSIFLASIAAIVLIRSIYVLVTPPSAEQLAKISSQQYQRRIAPDIARGTIFDRRRVPLAITTKKPSIYVNPRIFNPTKQQIKVIQDITKLTPTEIRSIKKRQKYFHWLVRRVSKNAAEDLTKLGVKGLGVTHEPYRTYPSQVASQLIGYVGIDNRGLMGIEKVYNDTLDHKAMTNLISRDAKGRFIYGEDNSVKPEELPKNLHLTIDRAIQKISEEALTKAVKSADAKSGFAVVSDPHTGHILAVANYPSFNPNSSKSITANNSRNYAFYDLIEPGSTIKPFVLAGALEKNSVALSEIIDVNNGVLQEDSWRIRDSHPSETLSASDVIVHSSNIGIFKIARKLGPTWLASLLRDLGIGERAFRLGFAQQAQGRLTNPEHWRPVRFANISFGQGFLASGLEIVQAYGAIANGGRLMKPILIKAIESADSETDTLSTPVTLRRVFSLKTATTMKSVLEKTVLEGSGKRARSQLYTTAGKTGTTEKVDPKTKTYSENLRVASFAGFAPVSDPHLVVYVVIDEPQNKPYYGGVWAAPAFREIVDKTLKYLNVGPDNAINQTTSSMGTLRREEKL